MLINKREVNLVVFSMTDKGDNVTFYIYKYHIFEEVNLTISVSLKVKIGGGGQRVCVGCVCVWGGGGINNL